MQRIAESKPFEAPPEWAVLERYLIDEIGEAVDPVLDAYTHPDRTMMWPPGDDYVGMDALDDSYESFYNWPLAYVLGADEKLFTLARDQWKTITEQFADVPTGLGHPQVIREYQQGHDWFHQSEGNLLFYHLCMAAPTDDDLRDRALRFAGFYLNEHPDVPPNYDPELRLMYCPMNGSAGPAYGNFSEEIPPAMYHAHSETRIPWGYETWKEHYGLPYYDLEGIDDVTDLKDEEKARRMGEALRDRCAHTDTPQNLPVTGLLANAYFLSGADTFKQQVEEYVQAWIERTDRNGGILPDNVDHSDEIGGSFADDGRWFGGWYGWTWPHGLRSLAPAVTGAAITAMLLSGDQSYLEFPRSQFDRLEELGYEEQGTVYVPYRYGYSGEYPRERGQDPESETGWFDFQPLPSESLVNLWFADPVSGERDRLHSAGTESVADWQEDGLHNHLKDFGGNDHAWIHYLDGDYPEYPLDVLRKDLRHVRERLEFIDEDDQDPDDYGDYYFAKRNPVTTESLVQLTTGAPQEIFNGGLPLALIRHFDPDRERPGLPPGVAALVSDITKTGGQVELVNIANESRTVVMQAGGYAEHDFQRLTVGDDVHTIQDCHVAIDLDPETHARIDFTLRRFVNQPTYAFPWHASIPST